MSTAPNLRMLFNTYHAGFDNYGRWRDHYKALHAKHPLGCAEFGAEWLGLWEALGRLLKTQSVRECQLELSGVWYAADLGHVGPLLRQGTMYDKSLVRRVVLLDGTVVKEWGGT